MSEKLPNIFSSSKCLSPAQLESYARGTLTATEQQAVEKHLLDCELCSDALEGIVEQIQKINLQEDVKAINQSLKRKYIRKHTIFFSPLKLSAIAAAILLLLFSASVLVNFFLYKDLKFVADKMDGIKKQLGEVNIFSRKQVSSDSIKVSATPPKPAIQRLKETTSESDAIPSEANESSDMDSILSTLIAQEQSAKQELKGDEPSKEKTINQEESKTFAEKLPRSETEPNLLDATSAPVMPQRSTLKNTETEKKATATIMSASANEFEKVKTESKTNEDKNTVLTNEGIQQYGARNYAKAIKVLEAAISTQPNNYTARYFLGQSYFASELYIEAIRQFDAIIIGESDTYFDDARYYKALAHVRIDDPVTAKRILNELIAEGSSYKKKAEAILLEMK